MEDAVSHNEIQSSLEEKPNLVDFPRSAECDQNVLRTQAVPNPEVLMCIELTENLPSELEPAEVGVEFCLLPLQILP